VTLNDCRRQTLVIKQVKTFWRSPIWLHPPYAWSGPATDSMHCVCARQQLRRQSYFTNWSCSS